MRSRPPRCAKSPPLHRSTPGRSVWRLRGSGDGAKPSPEEFNRPPASMSGGLSGRSLNVRSLDRKLENIRKGKYKPDDFIIADAKDGDIGFGRASPVRDANGNHTPRETHLQAIRDMTRSGLVDIMLMSASTAE